VNRSWDEHCKQQEVSHSRQVAALNAELAGVRQRLDDRQKSDDERQKEFDELILSAKKQRSDEEVLIGTFLSVYCHVDFMMNFFIFLKMMICC